MRHERTTSLGALARLGLVLAAGAVALVVVLALMLTDHTTIRSAEALQHVAYGRPLAWVTQDQGASDPPSPSTFGLGSPLEDPTHVHWAALVLDTVAVWVALVLLGVAVSRLRRTR